MSLCSYQRLMFNQTLHRNQKHICRYCFRSFSIAQTLERRHVDEFFKINGKQIIKMAKKVKLLNLIATQE